MGSTPPAPRAPVQRRYRSNRKQYHSCDHCRKGRRGCDAVRLGIDPLGRADPNNRCSMCQRYRKQCTFEWLRSVPVDVLPRRIKTAFGMPSQNLPENSVFGTLPSLLLMPPDTGSFPASTTNPQDAFHDQGTSSPRIGGGHLLFPDVGLRVTENDTPALLFPASLSGPDLAESYFGTARSRVWPGLIDQQPNYDNSHSVSETMLPKDSNYGLPHGATDPGYTVHMYEDVEFQPGPEQSWTSDPKMPQQSDLLAGRHPFPSEWNSVDEWPDPTVPFSGPAAKAYSNETYEPRLSSQECQLADTSNKISVSDGLMKIYQQSLENALSCWITAENCPFNVQLRRVNRSRTRSIVVYSPAASGSLYSRVFELDAGFASLRTRPLTRAEHSGSSRALKLAIVAFASQWSYSSHLSPSDARWTNRLSLGDKYASERQPRPNDATLDSYDFERVLRQSVWNEARRCINRWKCCGSFRVIFAIIMFTLTQRPPDEDELDEPNDETSLPPSSHTPSPGECLPRQKRHLTGQAHSPVISNSVLTSSSDNPQTSPFPEDVQGDPRYLRTAIHHLLNWKGRLLAYSQDHRIAADDSTSTNHSRTSLLDAKTLYDFNLFFWLGIMCDTTASVLGRCSLIAPDSDTLVNVDLASPCVNRAGRAFEDLQTPFGMISSRTPPLMNIWGSYIIEVDESRASSLATEYNLSADLNTKTLQAAVPLKVLFWRKVGKMQEVLSKPTSPAEVESTIKEALHVYDYWIMKYDKFFKACVNAHSQLSFQVQSWHLVLGMGWNLGCLLLAKYVEFVDQNSMSEELGRSLRASSAFVNELRKSGAYSIANLARISCSSLQNSTSLAGKDIHFAISQSAILAEPHPEKLIRALETSCQALLDWLRCWRSPTDFPNLEDREWLYANTSSNEISRHCVSCIEALKVLRRNSDAVSPIIYRLTMQHRLLELGYELQTESSLSYTF
ncbi:hypothetical protein RBB50_003166 [Rhinocladiella similis]